MAVEEVEEFPKLILSINANTYPITKACVHPSGRYFLTGGQNGTVEMVQLRPDVQSIRYLGHSGPVASLALHPTEDIFTTASSTLIRIWEGAARGQYNSSQATDGALIRSARYTHDGLMIIAALEDGGLSVYDTVSLRVVRAIEAANVGASIIDMRVSPDDKYAVLLLPDRVVYLSLATLEQTVTIALPGTPLAFDIGADGASMAVLLDDQTLLYDIRYTHDPVEVYPSPQGQSVAVGEGTVIIGTATGAVLIHPSGEPIIKIECHTAPVTAVAISGSTAISCGESVAVWALAPQADLRQRVDPEIPVGGVQNGLGSLVARLQSITEELKVVSETADLLMRRMDTVEAALDER